MLRKNLNFFAPLLSSYIQTDRAVSEPSYVSYVVFPLWTLYVEAPLLGWSGGQGARVKQRGEGGDQVSAISCAEDKQGRQMAEREEMQLEGDCLPAYWNDAMLNTRVRPRVECQSATTDETAR